MSPSHHYPLYLKHRVVGTRVERPLATLRWLASAPRRVRNPELTSMFHEHRYVDLLLDHLVQPAWTCIDGGAHIGAVTARFFALAPAQRHLVIEPVPRKAAWLRAKYPRAEIHQVALGDVSSSQRFYEDDRHSAFSSLRPQPDEHASGAAHSYDVDVVMLDDLVGTRRVDLVKLDLEGAELLALRGARQVLTSSRPVVIFECGPAPVLDSFGYDRTDLWDALHDADYDVYLAQDVAFGREPMGRDEFRRAGTYPFPGFNFVGLPAGTPVTRLC